VEKKLSRKPVVFTKRNVLPPWSKELLGMLIVAQMVKKFPAF
jgi:hypothetical protein